MSTAEFILAFIRFVNRYGIPLAVYSDSAKSFLQAGGIIKTYCHPQSLKRNLEQLLFLTKLSQFMLHGIVRFGNV